jgi:hypothetical protein
METTTKANLLLKGDGSLGLFVFWRLQRDLFHPAPDELEIVSHAEASGHGFSPGARERAISRRRAAR